MDVLRALNRQRVEYVMIGGLAAIVRGAPLPTYDLDITPAEDRRNRARLARALADLHSEILVERGFVAVSELAAEAYLHDAPVVQTRSEACLLDIHFHPDGTGGYGDLHRWATSERLASDLPVHVASLLDIIRSKEAAAREQDLASLPALRATLEISLEQAAPARSSAR